MSTDVGAIELWDGRIDLHAEWVAGMPQWRWRQAATGLATKRQLSDLGLRPAGQEPYGRIVCRRGRRWAWLYRIDLAKPKRTPSAAQVAALDKAMAARRWCPIDGGHDAGYCIPWAELGMCVDHWLATQESARIPSPRPSLTEQDITSAEVTR